MPTHHSSHSHSHSHSSTHRSSFPSSSHHHYHSTSPGYYSGGIAPMPASAAGARKMQIIGAIMLPIGVVLLVIGFVDFSKLIFGGTEFDPSDFMAIVTAQMSAMGLLFAGIPITFAGLILLIIGSVRRSASVSAAAAVPSTIGSPVPSITSPVSELTPGVTRYCPMCGAPNRKDASICSNCSSRLGSE